MARKAPLSVSGVPGPLTDPASPIWHDREAVAGFADSLGLRISRWPNPGGLRDNCGEYRSLAVAAWMTSQGYLTSWNSPDLKRQAELGIPPTRTYPRCPHT